MPGKPKTRHSSGSCFGPPCELPDGGDTYTTRNVLAAFEKEKIENPSESDFAISKKLEKKVRRKFHQVNPRLVLIKSDSAAERIRITYQTATRVNQKKGITPTQRKNLLEKMDKIFDLIVCQCQFLECSVVGCTESTCCKVHINCLCAAQYKVKPIFYGS